MTFALTGALGKKTRFQQQNTAQLLLQVTSDLPKVGVVEMASTPPTLPKVIHIHQCVQIKSNSCVL